MKMFLMKMTTFILILMNPYLTADDASRASAGGHLVASSHFPPFSVIVPLDPFFVSDCVASHATSLAVVSSSLSPSGFIIIVCRDDRTLHVLNLSVFVTALSLAPALPAHRWRSSDPKSLLPPSGSSRRCCRVLMLTSSSHVPLSQGHGRQQPQGLVPSSF